MQRVKVLVKYSAEWCGPCKRIAPFVDLMTFCYQCIIFHVDVDEAQGMADVQCMPTFRLFEWDTTKPLNDSAKYLGMTLVQEVSYPHLHTCVQTHPCVHTCAFTH